MPYPVLPGAPVEFGDLPLEPVPANLDPPGDIVLQVFGDYLKAVMLSRLSASWLPVSGAANGSVPIVRTVGFNNPEDNTFNARDLPALFVFRNKVDDEKPERIADDIWEDTRRIIVLWVPNAVPQELRADRTPYLNAIRAAIKDAVFQERNSAWKKTGEADPYALIKGTCITTAAGLWGPPIVEGVEEYTLKFSVDGKNDANYVSLRATIRVAEGSMRDATGYPLAQNDGTIKDKTNTETVGDFSGYVP